MPAPEASQTVSGDHNIFTGTGDVKIVYELPPAEANERRSLLILLSRVRQFWIEGVLERSVYGAALLELGKERLQGAVEHPWERVLELPDDAPQQVPLDRSIVEVFHKSGRSLLIASEPGSGKTTTLLELARELLTCAERDPSQPAPVVFNLSTWGEKRQRLLDWLVGELASKYYVPSRIGRAWLQDNRLLLMLDGLDEVKSEHRAGCVESINSFIQEFGVPGLAVCSRLSEYTALPVRLKLQGAVRLQLLTPDQVDAYLAKAGSRLESLRRAIREDEVLQSLARTPLMLSIMSLAYQDQPVGALQGADSDTPESRRLRILETYVERMFERRAKARRAFAKGQTVQWLSWLAGQMQRHDQTIFLIERLQPSWLATRGERWIYAVLSRQAAGIILGISEGLFLVVLGLLNLGQDLGLKKMGLGEGLLLGAGVGGFFGLCAGAVDALKLDRGKDSTEAEPFYRTLLRVALHWLMFGLIVELLLGTFFRSSFGLVWALLFGVRGRKQGSWSDIQSVEALRWSWKGAGKGALWGGVVAATMTVLVGCLLSVSLQGWALVSLQGGWALALLVLWGFLLPLYAGLGLAFGGLTGRTLETKTTPNQGIRLSIRNALFGAFIIAFFACLAIDLTFVTPVRLLAWDRFLVLAKSAGIPPTLAILSLLMLVIAVPAGVYYGVFAGLWYGGMDALQHFVLRYLLLRSGCIPRSYRRFLDYTTQLVFLQKVGGGYMFIHRMLLEYFATRDDELIVEATPNAKPLMILNIIRSIFSAVAIFLLILFFLFLVSTASKLLPGQPGVYLASGNAWYDKGAYDKAIADYDKAI